MWRTDRYWQVRGVLVSCHPGEGRFGLQISKAWNSSIGDNGTTRRCIIVSFSFFHCDALEFRLFYSAMLIQIPDSQYYLSGDTTHHESNDRKKIANQALSHHPSRSLWHCLGNWSLFVSVRFFLKPIPLFLCYSSSFCSYSSTSAAAIFLACQWWSSWLSNAHMKGCCCCGEKMQWDWDSWRRRVDLQEDRVGGLIGI